jgi:hypothetical protein
MEVVLDGVQSQLPELVGHQDRDTLKEVVQASQGDLVAFVTLVEYILHLRKPPADSSAA